MAARETIKVVILLPQAERDFSYWQKHNSKQLDRIRDLIEATIIDPENGIGKPELLRYLKEETFSRRIDRQHRMVYSVEGNKLIIKQLRFHYQR
jgi:toxin YoeB